MGSELRGSFWPSAEQELLLAVALGPRQNVVQTWLELRRRLQIERLEPGSFVLLPLVYRALVAAGMNDPLLPRLKGIYKSTWAKNTLLIERARESAAALAAAELRSLIVDSVVTAVRAYPELGLRPTPYLNVLVPPEEAALAARQLIRAGWSGNGPPPQRGEPLTLGDVDGHVCLLRTTIAPDFAIGDGSDSYKELRDGADTVDLRGTTMPALRPADELLLACVSGARFSDPPTIQWIPDAAAIVFSAGDALEWPRLVRLALAHGQALRLRDALAYLAERHGVDVPPDAIVELAATRSLPKERFAYACQGAHVPGLGAFPQALGEHLAWAPGASLAGATRSLPAFLAERWGVKRRWQLPLAGGRRALRSLTGRRRSA